MVNLHMKKNVNTNAKETRAKTKIQANNGGSTPTFSIKNPFAILQSVSFEKIFKKCRLLNAESRLLKLINVVEIE